MIIIICGMLGSGKTTLAKNLSKKLNLRRVSGSEILKEIVQKRLKFDPKLNKEGFWETGAGKKGVELYSKDPAIFQELDQKILEIINSEDNLVVESRTMPWLSKKGFKIWLECKPEEAAKRMSDRSNVSYSQALKDIQFRHSAEEKTYKKMYGFEIGKDLKVFDLIVNNSGWQEEDTLKFVLDKIKKEKLK